MPEAKKSSSTPNTKQKISAACCHCFVTGCSCYAALQYRRAMVTYSSPATSKGSPAERRPSVCLGVGRACAFRRLRECPSAGESGSKSPVSRGWVPSVMCRSQHLQEGKKSSRNPFRSWHSQLIVPPPVTGGMAHKGVCVGSEKSWSGEHQSPSLSALTVASGTCSKGRRNGPTAR